MRSSSSFDPFGPLVGVPGGHEAVVFLDARGQADDVDRRATEERLVVADPRGGDPQLAELGLDELVDVVALGLVGIGEVQALGQHDELRADGVGLEPRHHERLAALAGGDQAVGGHGRRDVVIGEEDGEAGHVAVRAVGVPRPDGELLSGSLAVEHARAGIEVHAHHGGELRDVVVGGAGLDPAVDRLVQLAAGLEPLAAGVRHGPDRLLEQRAVGGDRQVDATADHLASQPVVVPLRVEAKERDPESVLATRGAVAATGVAPGPHEDRHDVQPEAERGLHGRLGDLHRQRDRAAAEGDGEGRGAVGGGVEDRPRAADQPGVGHRERGLLRHVASDAVGVGGLDHDRLPVAGRRELDRRRIDRQVRHGGRGLGGRREDVGGELGAALVPVRAAGLRGRGQDEEQQGGRTLAGDGRGRSVHGDRVLYPSVGASPRRAHGACPRGSRSMSTAISRRPWPAWPRAGASPAG